MSARNRLVFGTIEALWRYPVKSLLGESLEVAKLDPRGVQGDREFAVTWPDEKIASGKTTRRFRRQDGLLELSARINDQEVIIRFPSGKEVTGPSDKLDTAISSHFNQPVKVTREKVITHFDAGPVHILTTASLRWLSGYVSLRSADARRFRPNIVIDCPGKDRVEMDLIGKRLKIGRSVILDVREPTERCVMTTMSQLELPEDLGVLNAISKSGNWFGVYCDVREPGEIEIGEPVETVEA